MSSNIFTNVYVLWKDERTGSSECVESREISVFFFNFTIKTYKNYLFQTVVPLEPGKNSPYCGPACQIDGITVRPAANGGKCDCFAVK